MKVYVVYCEYEGSSHLEKAFMKEDAAAIYCKDQQTKEKWITMWGKKIQLGHWSFETMEVQE